ncbi:hypothetical protein [Priestia taiwanensis]|uniref:Uncharacterized protein n=1 Tax=Priestia taiwanensis TaxID=1347902 RepID=A0A917EKZ6_9BACI|nr:hypothetical protein [Priestia taiwanensis]MBM7361792.1 hypothetical protein [Priestia taiwanensis]GGE57041.1 hypothetical protein GCM10007140_04190 [Priestia taiwanensis]
MFDFYVFVVTIPLLLLAILFSQIHICNVFYNIEKSTLWGTLGLLLPFGLNLYVYQLVKLEKAAGSSFEHVTAQERITWRRLYMLVLIQYLLMFVIIGVLLSPGATFISGYY